MILSERMMKIIDLLEEIPVGMDRFLKTRNPEPSDLAAKTVLSPVASSPTKTLSGPSGDHEGRPGRYRPYTPPGKGVVHTVNGQVQRMAPKPAGIVDYSSLCSAGRNTAPNVGHGPIGIRSGQWGRFSHEYVKVTTNWHLLH